MSLCTVCKNIPSDFFAPLPESFVSHRDQWFQYPHHTPTSLRRSAGSGCPMCKILSCELHDNSLDKEIKDNKRLIMKRAIIDPVQAFDLCMGVADFSHNFFYHMPDTYVEAFPSALGNGSDDEDKLLRHWVNECIQNHEHCQGNYHTLSPKRLLDLVHFHRSGDVVLVEADQASDVYCAYTTLSYCWGPLSSSQVTTTSVNIADRKERIKYDDLPLTFKDAFTTTRMLKIPYLWIDALCIIQDSQSDWEQEAARMGSIYAGSVCTLSALAANDSHAGFFRATKNITDSTHWYDLNLGGTERIRLFATEPKTWELDGPVMNRAWTLQEQALSNRIIHFSRHELLWECKTLKGSVEIPWIRYKSYGVGTAAKLLYDSVDEASVRQIECYNQRDRWFNVVEDYTRRKLTYSKDKLVALSGIAHHYKEDKQSNTAHQGRGSGHRDSYAAGIWECDLPSALLWRTDQSASRMSPYRAPTWSWACVDGQVTYDSQRIRGSSQDGGIWLPDENPANRDPSEQDFGAFHVRGIETTPSPVDPMGAVSAGLLTLEGLLVRLVMDEVTFDLPQYKYVFGGRCTWLRDLDGNVVGILLADIQTEVERHKGVYCLSIRREIEDAAVEMRGELVKEYHGQFGPDYEKLEKVRGLGLVVEL